MKTVAGGEPLLVTDRRKPVAVLQPLEGNFRDEQMAALVAAGIVAPPRRSLRLRAFLKLPKAKAARTLTAAVLEDREDR